MKQEIVINGKNLSGQVAEVSDQKITLSADQTDYSFNILRKDTHFTIFEREGKLYKIYHTKNEEGYQFVFNGFDFQVEDGKQAKKQKSLQIEGEIVSPMPGKIFKVLVEAGQEVKSGDSLIVLEAMKMEHTIKATKDGTIKKILFKEGDQVGGQAKLIEFD